MVIENPVLKNVLHFVKPDNDGREQEQFPACHANRSRVALAQAAAISDSFIHFPASQKLILAWQTLPLITDFVPTTLVPPYKKAQISHHSEESLQMSFVLSFPFTRLHFFQNKLFCFS